MSRWHYGDVVVADLDPSKGHEQTKRRPLIVVSNDDFNRNCNLTVVIAISHGRSDFELHVPFEPVPKVDSSGKRSGRIDGYAQIEQIRALDLTVRNATVIGRIKESDMDRITGLLLACFIQPGTLVLPDYG